MIDRLSEIKYTTSKFIEEFTLVDGDRILKLLSSPCLFVGDYEEYTKSLNVYEAYCVPWCVDAQGEFFQEQVIKKSFVDSDGSEHIAILPTKVHFLQIADIMNRIGYTIQTIEGSEHNGKPDIRLTLSNGIKMNMRWERVGENPLFQYQSYEAYVASILGSLKYSSSQPGMSACRFAIEDYGTKKEKIRIWMDSKFPNVYMFPFVVYKKDLSKNLHMSK